jgi:hypothetical protein
LFNLKHGYHYYLGMIRHVPYPDEAAENGHVFFDQFEIIKLIAEGLGANKSLTAVPERKYR